MKHKNDIDEAIRLYREGEPVADITKKTGVTRTRLYNNLRKRGISANRQISLVKAEAERSNDFWIARYQSAREEVGKLKHLLDEAETVKKRLRAEIKKLRAE